ncbi:VOC family protein [Primorskyibacter flagellatus]|uniref:VOC domain-containing protein n=1 Tax=Primorskyibacter flagellatus TaxID=1387277 RepID=A0A1W1Z384_9RHOB|nr:VOC family protein [Primorskyibacter flagellatus]SMC42844.1 hypothetical protein SAMN06295998_101188 [Primorskyibacter flagellatus]
MPHFEIHAEDPARARAFYTGLFGWEFTPMPGGEEVDYHLIDGKDLGDSLTGGLMKRMDATPAPNGPIRGCTLTFEVADVDERYAWALEHGGAEALPPTDYPGVGRAAYVEDGQGNVVGFVTPAETES